RFSRDWSSDVCSSDLDPQTWGERLALPGTLPFAPVVDGGLLPRRPIDGLRAGEGAGVDLMVGTTAEEFRLYRATGNGNGAATDQIGRASGREGVEIEH